MYNRFFGFNDRPFQLVPNPRYLFLSPGHETALAHLTYALEQGEGFAAVTGEAGTGKTTVCRSFLDGLGADVVAAYIFNPRLDAIQLLKAVNDEFEIPSDADNIKDLIDRLNAFLLEKKAEGKKAILLIDEAQNLDRDVLEQVRLLSNLETASEKLLQIILVGQPELGEMLDAYDLRQLAQRISLSCHLSPLSLREMQAYVRHRLALASSKPGVRFTRPALKTIHRFSGGIPRLVNIACDRCLLAAFAGDKKTVNRAVARGAVRELHAGRSGRRPEGRRAGLPLPAAAIVLLLVLAGSAYFRIDHAFLKESADRAPRSAAPAERPAPQRPPSAPPAAHADPVEPAPEMTTPETPTPQNQEKPLSFQVILETLDPMASRRTALFRAMALWGAAPEFPPALDAIADEQLFFNLAARQNDFEIYRFSGSPDLLGALDLPAILKFSPPRSPGSGFMLLEMAATPRMRLRVGDRTVAVGAETLNRQWSGVAYILWKDFYNLSGVIPRNAPAETALSLKMLLREIGFDDLTVNADYDRETREAVEAVQAKLGLTVDGVVGPATKIGLYNLLKDRRTPSISG